MTTNRNIYAPTYARGVEQLSLDCKSEVYDPHPKFKVNGVEVVRPFTVAENMRARVEDFNRLRNADGSARSLEDRLALWNAWLDSCTGVANKAGTNKFKLIPVCKELIMIAPGFTEPFLPCEYDSLDGVEFNSRNRKYKYNKWMTQENVLAHPAWIEATEHDADLLREYATIAFANFQRIRPNNQPEQGMSFYVRQNTKQDELRPLGLVSAGSSIANGSYDLSYIGRLARVRPQ